MKKIGLLALLASGYLHAGVCIPDHCAGVYIETLYIESSGTIYVGTSGDESKLNCQAVAGVYVTIPANAVGASALYSTLLTAQTTNKKIATLQVDDHQPGCIVQYITLERQ